MKKIKHYFGDMVIANGYAWFADENMNALFKVNIKTLRPEFVRSFPNESTTKKRNYVFIVKSNDKIICFPNSAKEIALYDIVSGGMEKIMVGFDRYSWNEASMYGGCAIGKYVYLFRRGYSSLYQLDTDSCELNILDIVDNETGLEADDYFWHWKMQQHISEEKIILYDKVHRILYQYNTKVMETEKKFCLDSNQELVDFVFDGHFVWVLCNNGTVYKLEDSQILDKYQCGTSAVDNFSLYHCEGVIYVIDTDTGTIILTLKNNEVGETKVMIPVNNTGVVSAYPHGSKIVMQWKDGFFYYYDGVDEIAGFLESYLEDIPVEAYFPNDIIYENMEYPLDNLLGMVYMQQPSYLINSSANKSGKVIYNNTAL